MKRILNIILCLCTVITLSGCSSAFNLFCKKDMDDQNDNVSDKIYHSDIERDLSPPKSRELDSDARQDSLKEISLEKPMKSCYSSVKQENGYASLKDTVQQKTYNELEEAVYKISPEKNESGYYPSQKVTVEGTVFSEDIVRKIIGAFNDDHPFEFWIANTFGYAFTQENTFIQLYSILSPEECNGAISQLVSRVNTVISNIPQGLSEYKREKYVHDWLIDNCQYDSDAIYLKKKWASFNVYGAIVGREAVCEGYSKAMQLLLNNVGIYCRLISGDAKNIPHEWNLAYIDKKWYHVDVTWNDSSQARLYNYFNVNDDIIKLDHKIYPDFDEFSKEEICGNGIVNPVRYNVNIPKCDSNDANYYNVEAIEICSFGKEDDKLIIDKLYKKISSGNRDIPFLISDSLNYENTVSKMLMESPYKLLYYVDSVNKILDDKKIDRNNIFYVKVESQNVIIVNFSLV